MLCDNCGKKLPYSAKACPSCGTPIASPEDEIKRLREAEANCKGKKRSSAKNGRRASEKYRPRKEKQKAPKGQMQKSRIRICDNNAVRLALNTFLCILLTLTLLVASLALTLRGIISESNFDRTLDSICVSKVDIGAFSEYASLGELIHSFTKGSSVWKVMTVEDLNSLLDKTFVKTIAGDVVGEYRDYFVNGELERGLTPAKMVNFLKLYEGVLYAELLDAGYTGEISFNYAAELERYENMIGDKFSTKNWEENFPTAVHVARFCLSNRGVVTYILTLLLIALLLALVNRYRLKSACLLFAVPTLAVSLILTLSGVIGMLSSNASSLVGIVSGSISLPLLWVGIPLLALGVICLILRSVLSFLHADEEY